MIIYTRMHILNQKTRRTGIVEVKRMKEISREIIADVDRKVRAIKRREGVSIRTALVYDGHLAPVAKADGYFDAIIPISKLLGLE